MRLIGLLLLVFTPDCRADRTGIPFPPVSSPSKAMTVVQRKADAAEDESVGLACLTFADHKHSNVFLDLHEIPWKGIYSFSPDEKWLLRDQKTGSGESIGILYRILKDGTVMQVLGFNEGLWRTWNEATHLKPSDTYHAGLASWNWSDDHKHLLIALDAAKMAPAPGGDELHHERVKVDVTYDLEAHTFKAVEKPRPH